MNRVVLYIFLLSWLCSFVSTFVLPILHENNKVNEKYALVSGMYSCISTVLIGLLWW